MTLTPAGQVLAGEARAALDAVSAATARTRRAGTRDPRVLLAVKPGGDAGLLPAILAAYEREPGVLPIEVVFGGDRARMLREGQADAALLYSPPDDVRGLDTETLLVETPVAVLPVSHPLARRESCHDNVSVRAGRRGSPLSRWGAVRYSAEGHDRQRAAVPSRAATPGRR